MRGRAAALLRGGLVVAGLLLSVAVAAGVKVPLAGSVSDSLGRALEGVCTLSYCASLEQAVQDCAASARPGETVLLSPACASLDMFRDYAHRGSVFAAAVQELP